jgi:hypothetical protein
MNDPDWASHAGRGPFTKNIGSKDRDWFYPVVLSMLGDET